MASTVVSKRLFESKVSTFFSKKKELNSLSNFWEGGDVRFEDEGEIRIYRNGESCFHGEKYIQISKFCEDENRKRVLEEYGRTFGDNTPEVAKKRGGKKGLVLEKNELEIWNFLSWDVQKQICIYKILNFEEVRNDLKKCEGKILVHPAMRCSDEKIKSRIWEGRAVLDEEGNVVIYGENRLGNIWMDLINM